MKKITKLLIMLLAFLGISMEVQAVTVTIGTITPNPICGGSTITVPFTITNGSFPTSERFTAQLSDAAGSFTTYTAGAAFLASPVTVAAPILPIANASYKIRVVAYRLINNMITVDIISDTYNDFIIRPNASVPMWNAPTIRCQGQDSISYAVANAPALNAFLYTISPSTSGSPTIDPTTGMVSFPETFNGVTTITATGCNSLGQMMGTYQVNTLVAPVISVTQSPITASVCDSGLTNIMLITTNPNPNTIPTFQTVVDQTTPAGTGASSSNSSTIMQRLFNPADTSIIQVKYIARSYSTMNSLMCPSKAKEILVAVNPTPRLKVHVSPPICSGMPPNFTTNFNNPGGAAYTWALISPNLITPVRDTGIGTTLTINKPILPNTSLTNQLDTARYAVVITVTTGAICTGLDTVYIPVNPVPVLTSVANKSICSGTSTNITLPVFATGMLKWTATGSTTITGFSDKDYSSGNTAIMQTLTDTSNANAGMVTYAVTPKSNVGCLGIPITIIVTVNPKPDVTTASTNSICSELATNIVLSASTPSTFGWTAAMAVGSPDINGFAPGQSLLPGDTTIAQTLNNHSNSNDAIVQYSITPISAQNCPGNPKTITTTVHPKPVLLAPLVDSICSGGTYAF